MNLYIFYLTYTVIAGGFIGFGCCNNSVSLPILHDVPNAAIQIFGFHKNFLNDPAALQYVKNVYFINGWDFSEFHILEPRFFKRHYFKYNRILDDFLILQKLVTFNPSCSLIEGMLLPFDKSFFGHVSSALPWKFEATSCGPNENFKVFYNLFSEGRLTKYSYTGKVCAEGVEIRLINDINYLKGVIEWIDTVNYLMNDAALDNMPWLKGFRPIWLENSDLINYFENGTIYQKQCQAFTIWFHHWSQLKEHAHLLPLFKMPMGLIDSAGLKSCELPKGLLEDSNYGITSILIENFEYVKPNLSSEKVASILNSSLTRTISTIDFFETPRYVSASSKGYIAAILRDMGCEELARYLRYDTVTKSTRFWSPSELAIVREAKMCVNRLFELQGLSAEQYTEELAKVITTISDGVINRKSDVWLNHIHGSEPFTSLPIPPEVGTVLVNLERTIDYTA